MSVNQKDIEQGRINDQLESQLESFSDQVQTNGQRGRKAMSEWYNTLSEKSSEFADTMNRYSREHPWRMVSSALALGLVLGAILGCQGASRSARF